MADYAPDDQRKVHNDKDATWREQEEQQRSEGAQPGDQQQALDAQVGGPRPEYDQYEVNQASSINKQSQAQSGYGNARDEDGQMEQDVTAAVQGDEIEGLQPGEISGQPDKRAAADAARPLSGS